MKTPDSILLFVLGFIVWILGSVYYAYRGPSVLETTSLRYWISLFISPTRTQLRHTAASGRGGRRALTDSTSFLPYGKAWEPCTMQAVCWTFQDMPTTERLKVI